MKRKSNLDEMQEQKLLHIESRGYWLSFWLLAASLVIQLICYGPGTDWRFMAAEWLIFMIIALYVACACMKAGIWDRKLKPTLGNNLLMSFCGGAVMGIAQFVISYRNYHKPVGSIAAGIFSGLIVMFLCLIGLTITASIYKKRKDSLEKEKEEEE